MIGGVDHHHVQNLSAPMVCIDLSASGPGGSGCWLPAYLIPHTFPFQVQVLDDKEDA